MDIKEKVLSGKMDMSGNFHKDSPLKVELEKMANRGMNVTVKDYVRAMQIRKKLPAEQRTQVDMLLVGFPDEVLEKGKKFVNKLKSKE